MPRWTHQDSEALYSVPSWGGGFFRIDSAGHVRVHPDGDAHTREGGLDLVQLIRDIRRRGIEPPILLRFDGILRSRLRQLCEAFAGATAEFGFEGAYRPVYPIKVNQQRHVVEALLEEGRRCGMGLEVGSKPELLAVLALDLGERPLLLCNGYKDREYLENALLASKLGITPVIVIEKYTELAEVLAASERLGIEPVLGVRTKLGGPGSGRWKESGGDRSKFGLTTRQIVMLVEELRERGLLSCLRCLHYHIGSQITDIRSIKGALREATRTLVGLHRLGVHIEWFDVGGGLGIDYDGSNTNFESSVNYSLQEYANDVVYHLHEACQEEGLPAPTILTESGRALAAHHSVLVSEVIGVSDYAQVGVPTAIGEHEHEQVANMAEVCELVTSKNYLECFHDAVQIRDESMMLFELGQLSLPDRARMEEFYWRTCSKILRLTRTLEYVPDDLAHLERDLADNYFVNGSIFQSIPDSWAIQQLFPVLPIHRHDEEPQRRGVLADITCDSDGKIDRFIDRREVKRTLELHELRPDEPYYLGFFLVGAYQEILGDMHNLFGDTHAVHVDSNGDGRPRLAHVVRGDRVQDVLGYVEYFETELLDGLRRRAESAIESDRMSHEDSARLLRRYVDGLAGYTYLTRPVDEGER